MLLFTKSIALPAIWGGTLLRDYFRYPEFPDGIGQSWSFSAQAGDGMSNEILNGPYRGQTLARVWQERPELFKSRFERFPVIISLVAPEDDLSIQIHPNAEIAARAGFPSGKNEAWYFLEAKDGAEIVYGQNAHDEAELRALIAQEQWNRLIGHLPVHKGDFVYLPAGMLHALKKGSIVYEIQQATDVTYRFYDYHRKDAHGNERPLQLEQAVECVDYGLTQNSAHPTQSTLRYDHAEMTTFVSNDSFCVKRYRFDGAQSLDFPRYELLTCVDGEGTVDGLPLSIGVSVLVTAESTACFDGQMTLMCTCEG